MASSVSRRKVLSALAAAVACGTIRSRSALAQATVDKAGVDDSAGPTFAHDGPSAMEYGLDEGYPVPGRLQAILEGNPWAPKYRVGAFSHLDKIYTTRTVHGAAVGSTFKRSAIEVSYRFRGRSSSLADYVERNPVTSLLIAKDDRILFERYQYARTDHDLLLSQSMVKSITGVLIGIAIADRAIGSVDDTPDAYVTGFKDTEYGRTPIRDLLHMSSGVDFGEQRNNGQDLDRLWRDMVLGVGAPRAGTIRSITQFNRRVASPGTRFYYASIEADVLGVVLQYATGKSASAYLEEKVWQPIEAEADAKWLIDAEGLEVAHFGFNAVVRDYARLARLLAHDGAWGQCQVIPEQWMIEATTVRPSDAFLAPGKATSGLGYGYLLWLLPGSRRQFALVGQNGQRICIDPISKLIMVQTALEDNEEIWRLWSALTEQLG
jgi:CubicO group peptidase (beta-lactamase class C family)